MEKNESEPLIAAFEVYDPNSRYYCGDICSDDLWHNITHVQKGNMHLYNYGDNCLVPRNHPLLIKCRGLVVRDDGKILNFPFERFFNYFEKEKAEINWNTAVIQEKLDGSLICTFWNGNNWEITTRGSFYPNEKHPDRYDLWFLELFNRQLELEDILDKNYCYQFELCSSHNRIVTKYYEDAVYLIGMRNLDTLVEAKQSELDVEAARIGVQRPNYFDKTDDVNSILNYFKDMKDDFEGFVVVDAESHRLKIKSETYCKLARIKNLSLKEIFYNVIGRREKQTDGTITDYAIDPEFLKAFPEVEETRALVSKWWKRYKQHVCDVFNGINQEHDGSRKEFAMEAIKYPCKGMLFALLDNKNLEEEIKYESIKDMLKEAIEKKQKEGKTMESKTGYEEKKITREIEYEMEELTRYDKEIAKLREKKQKSANEYDTKIDLYSRLKQQHLDSKKKFEDMLQTMAKK